MRNILLASLGLLALATMAAAQAKISGTLQCGKPDPQHAIEVGDRPGHSFTISQSRCTWTKPMEMAGTQTKEDVYTGFSEVSGNSSRDREYGVITMANGDKAYVRPQGSTTLKDGAPQSAEGKWSFAGGTGKLKGLKGQGTYKGKYAADSTSTWDIEGEYTLRK